MKRIYLWIRELSLTQQLITIVILVIGVFGVFLSAFLTPSIDGFTRNEIYRMLHSTHESAVYYLNRINIAVTRAENAIDLTVAANSFIKRAKQVLQVHQIILIIGAALQVLLPVYRPLIKKINTSIEVEGNGEMAAIDLNGEE